MVQDIMLFFEDNSFICFFPLSIFSYPCILNVSYFYFKNSFFTFFTFSRHRWIKAQSQLTPKNSSPIRKRNYAGKPVVPSPQLDYHNEGMFSLFKETDDKKDKTDSKPNEYDGRNNFKEYDNRKFQISIPDETINTNSNWTHLKVFRENVESEHILHQFQMLSARELKLVIEKILR